MPFFLSASALLLLRGLLEWCLSLGPRVESYFLNEKIGQNSLDGKQLCAHKTKITRHVNPFGSIHLLRRQEHRFFEGDEELLVGLRIFNGGDVVLGIGADDGLGGAAITDADGHAHGVTV